jgi:hypothetical protein
MSHSLVFQNIDPLPPLRPASVYPPPLVGGGGEDTLAGRRGGWGVNILEDERHRIALLQYHKNLSTFSIYRMSLCLGIAGPGARHPLLG